MADPPFIAIFYLLPVIDRQMSMLMADLLLALHRTN
jgi:hypothetical protein